MSLQGPSSGSSSKREERIGATGRPSWPLERQERLYRWLLVAADALALLVGLGSAYLIRFEASVAVFDPAGSNRPLWYAQLALGVVGLWLLLFWLLGLYDQTNLLGGTREYALAFHALAMGVMLVVMATFLNPSFVVARGWLLLGWVLTFGMVAAERFSLRRLIYRLRRRGWFLRPALVVGTNAEARALAEQLATHHVSGLDLRGLVATHEDSDGSKACGPLSVVGDLGDLEELVEREGIRELVVATSDTSRPQLVDIFRRFGACPQVQLRLAGGLFEMLTTGLEVKEMAYVPLLVVRPVRQAGVDRLLKLALDYGIAMPAVILGAPLLLAIAILVKLDSPGPALYRRRVLGLGGRPFDALKFRTMHLDGDAILAQHPEAKAQLERRHKLSNDPRVTRVGRILRKYSLDELPQFFNVLAGQMSVVGPRMISPEEQQEYGPWDLNLLSVKPGMTGLWQVSGRSNLDYEERVRLDMFYIRNWTIWLDLQILYQTIPAVLGARGAV